MWSVHEGRRTWRVVTLKRSHAVVLIVALLNFGGRRRCICRISLAASGSTCRCHGRNHRRTVISMPPKGAEWLVGRTGRLEAPDCFPGSGARRSWGPVSQACGHICGLVIDLLRRKNVVILDAYAVAHRGASGTSPGRASVNHPEL